MINNAVFTIERDKFLFLYNDLTAAQWVSSIHSDITDQLLVDRFMEIHLVFLGRLGRQDKGFFRKIPLINLSKVVRGWMLLYQCTINLLRQQHPRTTTSVDLVIGNVNWSERLKLSAGGLLFIDHSSRYAEYWAERSIKTKYGYDSLASRLSFVGHSAFNEYAQMVRKGELLVLDTFSNGVTSYDMMLFVRESGCPPELFLSEIKKQGWRVEIGGKKAIENIFQIYAKLEEKDLYVSNGI